MIFKVFDTAYNRPNLVALITSLLLGEKYLYIGLSDTAQTNAATTPPSCPLKVKFNLTAVCSHRVERFRLTYLEQLLTAGETQVVPPKIEDPAVLVVVPPVLRPTAFRYSAKTGLPVDHMLCTSRHLLCVTSLHLMLYQSLPKYFTPVAVVPLPWIPAYLVPPTLVKLTAKVEAVLLADHFGHVCLFGWFGSRLVQLSPIRNTWTDRRQAASASILGARFLPTTASLGETGELGRLALCGEFNTLRVATVRLNTNH